MPFRRRRRMGRRMVRRFPYRRRSMRSELKRSVSIIADGNVDATTGRVSLMNGIAEGAAINQRVGRRINMVSILLRGLVSKVSANTDAAVSIRFALAYDTQPGSALPVIDDFWDNSATTSNLLGPRKLDYLNRFKTLSTWTIVVHGTENVSTGSTQLPWEKYVKLRKGTYYDGVLGTIASLAKGGLYLFEQGSKQTSPQEAHSEVVATLRYKDP